MDPERSSNYSDGMINGLCFDNEYQVFDIQTLQGLLRTGWIKESIKPSESVF